MAKYQFFSMEAYSLAGSAKRWSAGQIVDELTRVPDASLHVRRPAEPEVIYGDRPEAVIPLLEERAKQAKDKRGHSFRRDGRCLVAAVFSYPVKQTEFTQDEERRYNAWESDTVAWAKKMWRENLHCVVRHTDEPYRHLHVIVPAPLIGNRLAIEDIHPGIAAAKAARQYGYKAGAERTMMKKALSQISDIYYKDVSAKHGHDRFGPRRKRLSRKEWAAESRRSEIVAEVVRGDVQLIDAAAKERARAEAAEKKLCEAETRLVKLQAELEKRRRQVERLLVWIRQLIRKRVRKISSAGGTQRQRPGYSYTPSLYRRPGNQYQRERDQW